MKTRQIPELWQKMMAAGWTHVTGLPVYDMPRTIAQQGHDLVQVGQIFPMVNTTSGKIVTGVGRNNGKTVAYLPDGSVWFRMGSEAPPHFEGVFENNTMFVPCSNGERLGDCWTTLMNRVADPFYNGGPAQIMQGYKLVDFAHVKYPATLEELKDHPDFSEKHVKAAA